MTRRPGVEENSPGFYDAKVARHDRQQESAEFVPAPLTGCICRDNHQPDESGFIYTSPSCLIHGPHCKQEVQGLDRDRRQPGRSHS